MPGCGRGKSEPAAQQNAEPRLHRTRACPPGLADSSRSMMLFPTAASRRRAAAIAGFLAVALGAMGAHALEPRLQAYDKGIEHWKTAALYHLVHAAVLWACATEPAFRRAWIFLLAGIVLFSGSLYVLCLTQARWLGAVTPFGGVSMLIGWGLLAWNARRGAE